MRLQILPLTGKKNLTSGGSVKVKCISLSCGHKGEWRVVQYVWQLFKVRNTCQINIGGQRILWFHLQDKVLLIGSLLLDSAPFPKYEVCLLIGIYIQQKRPFFIMDCAALYKFWAMHTTHEHKDDLNVNGLYKKLRDELFWFS